MLAVKPLFSELYEVKLYLGISDRLLLPKAQGPSCIRWDAECADPRWNPTWECSRGVVNLERRSSFQMLSYLPK